MDLQNYTGAEDPHSVEDPSLVMRIIDEKDAELRWVDFNLVAVLDPAAVPKTETSSRE